MPTRRRGAGCRSSVNGGAVALGHPYGMSGIRYLGSTLLELARRGRRRAIMGVCTAGGMSTAVPRAALTGRRPVPHVTDSRGPESVVSKTRDGGYAPAVTVRDSTDPRVNSTTLEPAPSLNEPGPPGWSIEKSVDLYQIRGWGEPYFAVNADGHVEVRPDPSRESRGIDLFALANDLKARGLELPLLVRFSDILRDRIRRLNECFGSAIGEYRY